MMFTYMKGAIRFFANNIPSIPHVPRQNVAWRYNSISYLTLLPEAIICSSITDLVSIVRILKGSFEHPNSILEFRRQLETQLVTLNLPRSSGTIFVDKLTCTQRSWFSTSLYNHPFLPIKQTSSRPLCRMIPSVPELALR